jgi:hypothetical protein
MLPVELESILAEVDVIDYRLTHCSDKKIEVFIVGYPASRTKDAWESEASAEVGETMRQALRKATRELYEAATALGAQRTRPDTPRPRRKEIELCPGFRWPSETRDDFQYVWALDVAGVKHQVNSESFIELMINVNRARPKEVLRTMRRLQQAAKWCRARIQGREKAARNVLCMQKWAQDAYTEIEAESVLEDLGQD